MLVTILTALALAAAAPCGHDVCYSAPRGGGSTADALPHGIAFAWDNVEVGAALRRSLHVGRTK